MARRSTFDDLAPEIRHAALDKIRDGASVDDVVTAIREMGGRISRSSAGRKIKAVNDLVKRQRDADRVCEIWIRELGERPEGRTGRMTLETLRSLAMFSVLEKEEADADEIATLALAMQRIERAGKISADRELAIRREAEAEAAKRAKEDMRKAGASDDLMAMVDRAILGDAA